MTQDVMTPIRIAISVPLPPRDAFDLFTARIDTWWPLKTISISQAKAATCFVEPYAGGRVYERSEDGEEHPWGEVLAFEPPERLVMSWHPATDVVTEVEVRFTPSDDGTLVELEHRGWEAHGARAEEARDPYANGWGFVFVQQYGDAARAAAGRAS